MSKKPDVPKRRNAAASALKDHKAQVVPYKHKELPRKAKHKERFDVV